jgi:hypothetical protein
MNEDDFAAGVIRVIQDQQLHALLSEGCLASAIEYTLENMVENFADGIRHCLAEVKPASQYALPRNGPVN